MAIYHFHAKLICRSRGESALAAAAYSSGSKFKDRGKDKVFNYQRKKGVVHTEILAPENTPAWVNNREELWNRVEEAEKRHDSQVARALVLALPRDFNLERQKILLREFLQQTFVEKGMIADFSIHHDNQDNPHVHVLLTTRKLENGGFTGKVREWNGPNFLVEWRKAWAERVNHHLHEAGSEERVDHRSYLEQGIDQQPTQHLGRINFYAHTSRNVEYDRHLANVRVKRVNGFLRTINNPVHLINRFGINAQRNIQDMQEDNMQLEVGVTWRPG